MRESNFNVSKNIFLKIFKWCRNVFMMMVLLILVVFVAIIIKRNLVIHEPININIDNITHIEIEYYDCIAEKNYIMEIYENPQIQSVIDKVNSIKGLDKYSYEEISYIIHFRFYDEDKIIYKIRITGPNLIIGEESYMMKEKDREELNEWVLDILKK